MEQHRYKAMILPIHLSRRNATSVQQRLQPARSFSLAQRHSLDLLTQSSPIIGLQFRILYPLLAPLLMQSTDVIL